jgi:uncharacterized membrane protein YkvA (DUF1232 family)
VLFDPGVDADVGLGQQNDAGEAMGLELMHALGEDMRAAAGNGGPEHGPERLQKAEGLRVAQPEVGQELAMDGRRRIVRHGVMVPDLPAAACEVVQYSQFTPLTGRATTMPKTKRGGAGRKALGFGGALRMLPMLWKYGQLAFSLLQDARVPVYMKVGLISGALLVLSPIDLIPEAIPVLGQISDFFILLLVIQLFLRIAPREVVDEHIAKLGLEGQVKVLLRRR